MQAMQQDTNAVLSMSLDDVISQNKSSRPRRSGGAAGKDRDRPGRKSPYAGGARAAATSGNGNTRNGRRSGGQSGLTTASSRGGAGSTKIAVTNLHFGVTEKDLWELFERIGKVSKISLNFDQNGRSQGTAAVTFIRAADALEAVKRYHKVTLDGRPMNLELIIAPEVYQKQIEQPKRERAPAAAAPAGNPRPKKVREQPKNATQLDAELDEFMQL
ncbi:hypothetical protein RI367_007010 [Sorochytrium milnesiophthora]